MNIKQIKANLLESFPTQEHIVEEYVQGIIDYNNEHAYKHVTLNELENDFQTYYDFRAKNLDK
jgi:hypothetical protein